ncbi:MAG: hypothetical protein JXB15_06740 [Anaerolineales bacterium]|nr:hypothetical protein [Anaerolineales bacterium]
MSEKEQATYILDDLPAERDALDFAPYVNTLAGLIQSPNTSTPLTIGVFGTWGLGVAAEVKPDARGIAFDGLPTHLCIAFQAGAFSPAC